MKVIIVLSCLRSFVTSPWDQSVFTVHTISFRELLKLTFFLVARVGVRFFFSFFFTKLIPKVSDN